MDFIFNVGDRVESTNTRYEPYKGVVSKVFVGLVRVDFDVAQGLGGVHKFTLTSPANIRLIASSVQSSLPVIPAPEVIEVVAPLPPYPPEQAPVVVAISQVEGVADEPATDESPVVENPASSPQVEAPLDQAGE